MNKRPHGGAKIPWLRTWNSLEMSGRVEGVRAKILWGLLAFHRTTGNRWDASNLLRSLRFRFPLLVMKMYTETITSHRWGIKILSYPRKTLRNSCELHRLQCQTTHSIQVQNLEMVHFRRVQLYPQPIITMYQQIRSMLMTALISSIAIPLIPLRAMQQTISIS